MVGSPNLLVKSPSQRREPVTACLKRKQLTKSDIGGQLDEYDFAADVWVPKARSQWPMERTEAENWLVGWNAVDRFAAMNRLLAPVPD